MNKILFAAIAAILIAGTFFMSSCKEDNNDPQPQTEGSFRMEFNHVWVSTTNPFVLNQNFVHPKTGDTLQFSTLKYYVSNIGLQKVDGEWWDHPESYFLIDLSLTKGNEFLIDKVPSGSYKAIRYTLGVDSTRNVSGAQSGALAASNGMFWSWNSGYIMIKAEGSSPQSGTGDFAFHLGGFSGDNNIVLSKTATFGTETLDIQPNATPVVHMNTNAARFWHSSPSVSVKSKIHMPGPEATVMGKDFYDWIHFDHIHK